MGKFVTPITASLLTRFKHFRGKKFIHSCSSPKLLINLKEAIQIEPIVGLAKKMVFITNNHRSLFFCCNLGEGI